MGLGDRYDNAGGIGRFLVGTWRIIDAVLENATVVDLQCDGITPQVEQANRLRDRASALLDPYPPDDAVFDLDLDASDIAFVIAQVRDAIEMNAQILAEDDLPPDVREEQEADRAGLRSALAQLLVEDHSG